MNGILRGSVASLFCAVAVLAAPVVREVQVQHAGQTPVDESYVRTFISIVPGGELDRGKVGADIKRLLAAEGVDDAEALVENMDGGVRLIYRVRPCLKLARDVKIEGARHLKDERVRDLLLLRPGDLVGNTILGARVRAVLDEYRDELYPEATAEWTITDAEGRPGFADVTLVVREGAPAWFADVEFPGATRFSRGELARLIGRRAWWNPMRWFTRQTYDPVEVDAGVQKIAALYEAEGYRDVAVGPAVIEGFGQLKITVPVREGTRYFVRTVSVSGATLFPVEEVRRRIFLKPGDVASSVALDDAERAVRDFYGSQGYVDTVVKQIRTPDGDRMDVVFAITEGELVHIRNIYVRGNTRTRDKVIRREVLVNPGEVFDEVRVRTSERRLMNLGFFETVRNRPEMTSNPGERDLVFDVEEKRTGQIMLGAGFSSIDRAMLFADISQGNFDIGSWPPVGGGQKLKLSTQLGSKRSDVTLSFVEPWFLDRKLSLGVDLYRNQVSYDEYDMERIGTAVSLARPLFGNVRGNLQYRLEREKVTDMADTNAYFYADNPEESYGFMRNENLLYSSLRFTMTRDSRDNPFIPRSGNLLTGFAGFAGGPLGADVDLYEVGFRSAHYLPLWFKHVVSLRLRYETVESYGGTDVVPVGSRLFAGGGRTIRGFEYRDVGPKVALKDEDGELVERSHKPVGGQSLAVANLEYTVPVFSMLRLAAFYDTGNVWRDSFDFEASGLAAGWGVGVRVDIPGFPIRIDRAWAVRKDDPMTDEEIVVFWIGYDN